mgnify:CR=1 FL=1
MSIKADGVPEDMDWVTGTAMRGAEDQLCATVGGQTADGFAARDRGQGKGAGQEVATQWSTGKDGDARGTVK